MELDNFLKQLSSSKGRIAKFKKEHDRNTLLYMQKVISEVDYEASRFSLNNEELLYNQLLSQQISDWQGSLTDLKEQT